MRWLVCAALLGAVGAAGLTGTAAAEPAPSVSATTPATVKYYVVGRTGGAEREYLFQIAARTLGDGHRQKEIFELNRGRLQPDGQRMDDPLVVLPGWVLLLPADAKGPGVLSGPAPTVSDPRTPPPASAAPDARSDDWLLRAGAIVLVTTILGVSLHLLRRGQRIELHRPVRATGRARLDQPAPAGRRPRDLPTDDGWPALESPPPLRRPPDLPTDDRWPTVESPPPLRRPPDLPTRGRGRESVPTTANGWAEPNDRGAESVPSTAHGREPELRGAEFAPTTANGREPELCGAEFAPTTAHGPTEPDDRGTESSGTESSGAVSADQAPRWASARLLEAPAPARPADTAPPRVELRLRSGSDQVAIRLVGARPDAGDAFFGRGEIGSRTGAAVVHLGDPGPGAAWLDLSASPDVVTVSGDPAGVRRLTLTLTRQLSRAGVPTIAVGDALGETGGTDHWIGSLDELADRFGDTPLLVAFVGDLPAGDVATLHELLVRWQPRVVPIVVGSGPRSRWSIDVA
ncbi:LysM peptidoglycan-binding domain-containing protein [Rhizomonospora bruguierae]|uniref:LysM peptidoglycan-binding domain-containing protein n=1 Tax=Rhizomonospora bruguierae TaxID=1581705 RepID=UPI001BCF8C6C|nr:hypothetical protein [Micromonospora sp. NBRC 107566]